MDRFATSWVLLTHALRLSKSFKRAALAAMMALALVLSLAGPSAAVPGDGGGGGGDDEGGGEEGPPYTAPAGGFDWVRTSRFGQKMANGVTDYHWDPATATYDSNWVNPPGGFPVHFNGCPTGDEAASGGTYRYVWQKVGAGGATTTLLDGQTCAPTLGFPEGDHRIKLTIHSPSGVLGPYEKTVTVQDFLIVSIGDSYGSGEGAPDVRRKWGFWGLDEEAKWVDRRCHRSAWAGSAQAARYIENADPVSTVTFLSFACSGATIETQYWAGGDATRPYQPPENYDKPVGMGVLGTYAGVEGFGPGEDPLYGNHLKPQIQQVAEAIAGRQIDALTVSGGGNDMGFGPVATVCVLVDNCPDHQVELGGGVKMPLRDKHAADMATLPLKYEHLAACLQPAATLPPGVSTNCTLHNRDQSTFRYTSLGVAPSRIYALEYPDQTKDDDGTYCREMLQDTLGWGFKMDAGEAEWAATDALGTATTKGLNWTVKSASDRFGWNFVGGVMAAFSGPGYGHGYCADDNWIRTATEAKRYQGPSDTTKTTGTLHPTEDGYRVHSDRLLDWMVPRLLGTTPDAVPQFSATNSNADGSTQSRAGSAGWLTGRCTGGPCHSDYAVATVTVTDPSKIRSGTLRIGGAGANCATPPAGVTCSATLVDDNTYRWSFQFSADGVYNLDFTAEALDGQSANYGRSVKVDLQDPSASATRSCSPTHADGSCNAPATVTFTGTDPGDGSGVAHIAYQLSGSSSTVNPGGSITLGTNGTYTISYRAVDAAGRQGPQQNLTVTVNIADGDGDGTKDYQDPAPTNPCVPSSSGPTCDPDGDQIANSVDQCDNSAEDVDGIQDSDGCPEVDADGDGVNDVSDSAPLNPCVPNSTGGSCDPDGDGKANSVDDCDNNAEDFDGFQDSDGCPDPNNDGDALPDDTDQCDNAAEDVDGFQDADGCPDPDNDNDGVADGSDPGPNNPCVPISTGSGCDPDGDGFPNFLDQCDNSPEDVDGFLDGDGCPEDDNDNDDVLDLDDDCDNLAEDPDGVADWDGCPEDNDEDTVEDVDDQCEFDPEDLDGFQDSDGCPDPDNDGDGVLDEEDNCALVPNPRQEDGDGDFNGDLCDSPHRRGVSLTLKRHLVARGSVAVRDAAAKCRAVVPLSIERKKVVAGRPRWVQVEEGRTLRDGTFAIGLRDATGTYRAVAPAHQVSYSGVATTCARAVSDVEVHRH